MTRTVVAGRQTHGKRRSTALSWMPSKKLGTALGKALPPALWTDARGKKLKRPDTRGISGMLPATAWGAGYTNRPVFPATTKLFLQRGTVITVEPGIYIPRFGGVRIEDMVVVEPDGSRLLTHAPVNS